METNIDKLYEEKLNEADKLISLLSSLTHLKGSSKLKKLIVAERTFLQKVAASTTKDIKHLSTTNLTHFSALLSTVCETDNCCSVLEPFSFQDNDNLRRIVVDIVKDEGKTWIKVTARNPKGLLMSCLGDTTYGSRTILDQAEDFVECAAQNPVFYVPPKVIFKFSSGIDSALATKMYRVGVEVVGDIIPSTYCSVHNSSDESDLEEEKEEEDKEGETFKPLSNTASNETSKTVERPPISKLNLDITALLAYVSDMTNGGTCENFIQEPLTLQAQSEKRLKVKEFLDQLFDGKDLYCCETAMSRFKEILEIVGGEKEKSRAKLFLDRITVVPDCVSDRVRNLKKGGQIKDRPQIIFGTGDSMQAITVSANWGFCRSAQHQGVHLATFLHEPRALSEQASYASKCKSS